MATSFDLCFPDFQPETHKFDVHDLLRVQLHRTESYMNSIGCFAASLIFSHTSWLGGLGGVSLFSKCVRYQFLAASKLCSSAAAWASNSSSYLSLNYSFNPTSSHISSYSGSAQWQQTIAMFKGRHHISGKVVCLADLFLWQYTYVESSNNEMFLWWTSICLSHCLHHTHFVIN